MSEDTIYHPITLMSLYKIYCNHLPSDITVFINHIHRPHLCNLNMNINTAVLSRPQRLIRKIILNKQHHEARVWKGRVSIY